MKSPPPPTPADWPDLVGRARTGDTAAWSAIVGGMGPRVMGLMVARTRDRDLAEELTAATFAKLVEVLTDPDAKAAYRETGRFEAWLFRIAMNKLRDEMNRRKRTTPAPAPGHGDAQDRGDPLDRFAADTAEAPHLAELAEDREALRSAVATLPEADREVLHLRHTAGLSFPQIAETLSQPLGTVLARAHRAHKKLARLLTPATAS